MAVVVPCVPATSAARLLPGAALAAAALCAVGYVRRRRKLAERHLNCDYKKNNDMTVRLNSARVLTSNVPL